jgi:hypothetical protein
MLQHNRLTQTSLVLSRSAHFAVQKSRNTLISCSSNAKQPSQTAGASEPLWQEQQQHSEDPVAAMMWAAQQDGMKIVVEDEDDFDELDDIMEDLEDPWMRNPSRESLRACGAVAVACMLPANTARCFPWLLKCLTKHSHHIV